MKNIYGKAYNYKTKADRLTILTSYRKNLLKLLREGFSPFEKITSTVSTDDIENDPQVEQKVNVTVENAFTNDLKKPATKADIISLSNKFERYHKVVNLPFGPNGSLPYFDMETKKIVYFKNQGITT
ncbi:hypothetical protein ACOCEA_10640 [Maribacter sp. CXY002]|uniref:hypothetical protein n=1 Tax=Maribacter luteocoastalis TaxID=3407671 RepID=UPI003B6762C7